uniref:Proto-oncogene DBL-like n=1 Tax=Sinocyclocheilus rhinocerous TaxID=307959 RepID=A0A673JUT3_9TELE
MSFPGHLHLVLVLRPKTHLQTTGTDIGFRFSQDDFALKMPMVMLSSLTDLLRFIDENQLSTEFGGTLEECHSDWIVLQTAIESFAVTVKEIAQLLQTFGTELSEIELPDEASGIEYLLRSHTEKYRQMKDDIRSVMREGRQLLSNLEASKAVEGAAAEDRDISQDKERVQRLVAQLRDMEMAFDGFFEKHHLKLQQYLQLLQYEMSFHEVQTSVGKLSAQEKAIASVGTAVAQTEQLLKDLEMLETTEEMGRAQIIILHGHQLAASHHYALALIVQRCNELRHHSDTLTTALRAKRASLTLCISVYGQTVRWCDEGAYLLANQLLDKFQSKEGAQAALQDIERLVEMAPSVVRSNPDVLSLEFEAILTPQLQGMIQSRQACLRKLADIQVRPIQLVSPRPENSPRCKSPVFSPKHSITNGEHLCNILTKKCMFMNHEFLLNLLSLSVSHQSLSRSVLISFSPSLLCYCPCIPRFCSHVMKELIETERIYVDELLSVLLGYRAEMDNPSLSNILPSVLRNKKEELFGNLPEIYKFHSRIFLQDLESCLETPERVGARFLERKENFQVYERYCQNKPRSDALWRQCSDSAFIQECKKKLDHKLGLDSYLLKPVQRLTKYQLLLKELLKHSSNSQYASELQGALNAMLDLLKSVNDSMHQIAITGYEGELSDLGRVLMQGSFNVWINHRKGPTRMKDMARFKPMQRHLFLHERALLFCKKREESGEAHDRTASYSFKHCLMMSAVGITENIKGDVRKFEIWYNGKEEVYVVQASTVDVKIAWLTEIRKILNNQQKIGKGSHTAFPFLLISWLFLMVIKCLVGQTLFHFLR